MQERYGIKLGIAIDHVSQVIVETILCYVHRAIQIHHKGISYRLFYSKHCIVN